MIRLIVNPETNPIEHLFYKDSIVIGSSQSGEADLSLAGEELDDVHIRIFLRDQRYIALNQANDPFVTINGLPFGKKVLHENDLLQIGKTLIRIHLDDAKEEVVATAAQIKESWGDTAHEIPQILEKALTEKQTRKAPHSLQELESDEYANLDIDELMRQVELLEGNNAYNLPPQDILFQEEQETPLSEKSAAPEQKEPRPKMQPLKDDYLKYLDDDTEMEIDKFMTKKWKSGPQKPPEEKSAYFKLVLKLFLALLIIGAILLSYWYYMLLERSEEEEFKAARAVSDIAMALNYANFYQVRPQNQNWSDPEFLKSNLTAILAKSFQSMVQLDHQGKFINTPYLLRIYTSSDLTQFLVLAQPVPSWEQWIVPKHSIAVSLNQMELRKMSDLRVINRILLHTETLDGNSQNAIDSFLMQNEMIPIKELVTAEGNQGFAPPKALGLSRPGAENYIYNAPRYYLFGESFIHRAIDLASNPDSNHEIGLFRQQVEKLSHFKDLVLYAPNGLNQATEAKKSIGAFLSGSTVSLAYLQYNSKGMVVGSHLLFEDAQKEIALTDSIPSRENFHSSSISEEASDALSLQLQTLAKERQAALGELSSRLIEMLQEDLEKPKLSFKKEFKAAYKDYVMASNRLNKKINQRLIALEQEYTKVPLCDFLEKTEKYGLEGIARPLLEKNLSPEEMNCQTRDFEVLLKKVDEADDLTSLNVAVKQISEFLGIEKIPNAERLITYQGHAKGHVQKKLSALLMSADYDHADVRFTSENRALLLSILQGAWISDPDEVNYYLEEFDLHMKEGEAEENRSTPPPVLQLGKTASARARSESDVKDASETTL